MAHTDPRDTWDKSCGRVGRLRANDDRPAARVDLARRSTPELIESLGDSRKWYRDHARRLLGERSDGPSVERLRRVTRERRGQLAREALWTANLISDIDGEWARALLDHPESLVRGGTLPPPSGAPASPGPGGTGRGGGPAASGASAGGQTTLRGRLIALARREPDPEVRSELASMAGRLPTSDALRLLAELLR